MHLDKRFYKKTIKSTLLKDLVMIHLLGWNSGSLTCNWSFWLGFLDVLITFYDGYVSAAPYTIIALCNSVIFPFHTFSHILMHIHSTFIHSFYLIYWMWYKKLLIYQSNKIIKKLANIQVNTSTTKSAQMQILKFCKLTWWIYDTRHPLHYSASSCTR